MILTSQTAANYKMVSVTESFLSGAPFSNDTSSNGGLLSRLDILSLQQQANRGELVNLTSAECVQEFGGAFSSKFNAVLLITNLNSQTSSLLQTAKGASILSQYGIRSSGSSSIAQLTLDRSTIRYCLAQPMPEQTCEIGVNTPLLGAVALLNLITVIAIAAVLRLKSSFEPLATLGDAVASFLKEPDFTTRGTCLLSKKDVWQGRWGFNEAKYWIPRDHYWLWSPSLARWLVAVLVWGSLTGLAAAALTITIMSDPSNRLSPFGAASPYTMVWLPPSVPDMAAALIASLPQLILAALYVVTNSLVTVYFFSHESSLFAVGPARPLRVSANPEGTQTASLYMTLPRPVSWLLAVVFVGLGFLLSQSCFVVSLRLHELPISSPRLVPLEAEETVHTALGFSGVGLLAFLAILVLLAVAVVGLGFRRAPPAGLINGQAVGNPMAMPDGSCSAVISARCHRRASERDLWRKNLIWGVVREGVGMDVSHATFTAGMASQVDVSRNYA